MGNGGEFKTTFLEKPTDFVSKFKGTIVHLTMYGEQIVSKIEKIKKENLTKDLLIIVGGPKVSRFYYEHANYNVSVTN